MDGLSSSLPDADYWLSREELILTYLHQRGALVPKVTVKNLSQKSLLMQDAGNPLSLELLKYKNLTGDGTINLLLLNSIDALLKIFDLGVLHLDIALRNIATPNANKGTIYILDFVHCLSQSNQLQKPLPLLPTSKLHHPLLFDALKNDWEKYFSHNNHNQPTLDSSLTLSDKEFVSYWTSSTCVQILSNNRAILCHGVGNLLNEVAQILPATNTLRLTYLEAASALQNLSEVDASIALSDVIMRLKALPLQPSRLNFSEEFATPIPLVTHFPSKTEEEPSSRNVPRKKRVFLKLPIKPINLSNRFSPKFFRMTSWICLVLNALWINLIIDAAAIKLNDVLLIMVALNFLCAPIALLLDILTTNPLTTKRCQFIFVFLAITELALIISYPKTVFFFLWLWLPSLLLLVLAFLPKIFQLSPLRRPENL